MYLLYTIDYKCTHLSGETGYSIDDRPLHHILALYSIASILKQGPRGCLHALCAVLDSLYSIFEYCGTVRVDIIGHFKPCTTDIYIHI